MLVARADERGHASGRVRDTTASLVVYDAKQPNTHIERQLPPDHIREHAPCRRADDEADVERERGELDARGVKLLLDLSEDDGDTLEPDV